MKTRFNSHKEKKSRKSRRAEKLICSIEDKEKYVVHIRALKQALNHGLKLKNVHRVIQFNPLMTTPRRNRTSFTEIKFCTLCLTIISCFEKIFMWRIGKVENIAVAYT